MTRNEGCYSVIVASKTKTKTQTKSPVQEVLADAPEEATPAVAWAQHFLNCWICHQVPSAKWHSYCSDGAAIYERAQRAA
jgi:hypothetical protein